MHAVYTFLKYNKLLIEKYLLQYKANLNTSTKWALLIDIVLHTGIKYNRFLKILQTIAY